MGSIFRLTAPHRMGQIPEGLEITVYTNGNSLDRESVVEALKRVGITDEDSFSYWSRGNWNCVQIK